ncbi:Lon protease C-terminal proteolytic domain-containing protein [Russula vinacea]|nr:Lon protease C-terminal proteolytic domain-containing protein [Russula vinacea]
MSISLAQSRLPLIPLPYPLILLPSARLTFPIPNIQADALIRLFDSSVANPVLAAVPFVQHEGTTSLNEWGVTARVARFVRPRAHSDEPYLLTLSGITRIRLASTSTSTSDVSLPLPQVTVVHSPPDAHSPPAPDIVQEFKAAAIRLLERYAQDTSQSARKRESWARIAHVVDETGPSKAAALADAIVSVVGAEHPDKLALLSTESPSLRLQHVTHVLTKQFSIAEVSTKIATAVDESLSKQEKAHFLRRQLAVINAELQRLEPGNSDLHGTGSVAEDEDDLDALVRRVDALPAGTEVRRVASTEARRLKRIPPQNAEHGVVRNYLEWLTALPWTPPPPGSDTLTRSDFLANAKSQLDADHFGLDKVKRRLTEYLAVVRLRALIAQETEMEQAKAQEVALKDAIEDQKDKDDGKASKALVGVGEFPSPQMLVPSPTSTETRGRAKFVGPPGTGKTSLGQSIARALGRPFQRIALGGVRDEAEIRGHRRTYVASGPGLFAQALRKAGRMDPVLLLDEIDKVGQSNYHGDPSAALLEVLDPEQNVAFNDHYINVPIDLSQVLFVCTANTLDTIAPALIDRCEQLTQNGLSEAHVHLTEPALLSVVTQYTREAGVRALERAVGGVVRFKAVEWTAYVDARGLPPSSLPSPVSSLSSSSTVVDADGLVKSARDGDAGYDTVVEAHDLEKILGLSRHDNEDRDREARCGVVWGLVVTGMGEGEIMAVESIATPGTGNLKLTGSLGDVIKESAELALSWVKTHAYDLGITNKRAQDPLRMPDAMIDVHLHLPAGAQKKDGPSAGVAMVCAIVSLLTGKCVPPTTAMTGEITLRGRVSTVLGAHRAGANRVILPWANRKDVEHDVPKEVRVRTQFVFARTVREVLDAAFGAGSLPWHGDVYPLVESRL